MIKNKKLLAKDALNITRLYVQICIQNIEMKLIKKSKLNITHRELIYLVFINYLSGEKMSTIASVLGVSKGAFSNAVNLLISKKLIIKNKNNIDPRITTLELIANGKKCSALHNKARKIINVDLKEYLTNKEMNSLILISDKVLLKMQNIKDPK